MAGSDRVLHPPRVKRAVARRLPASSSIWVAHCGAGRTLSFGDKIFSLSVSDSLPSLPNRAINIFLLPLPISFVRKVTRSKHLPRRVLRDAVGQSVDCIGEIHARLVAVVDWLRSEVLDALETTTAQARAPERDARRRLGVLRFI